MERIPDNQNSHSIKVTHVLENPLKALWSRPSLEEVVVPVVGLDQDVCSPGHVILEAVPLISGGHPSRHLHQQPQPSVAGPRVAHQGS